MKNFEKYEDEIRKFKGDNFCKDFVIPHILKKDDCAGIYCSECISRQLLWYLEEYEEPEVDWSNVPVDTLVRVRDLESEEWTLRYFKGIDEEAAESRFMAWGDGTTSKTAYGNYTHWRYCELVENKEEDNGKKTFDFDK